MNDHNLDDLIIDNIEPNKNNKTKSVLTIVALLIIVFIVAIILTSIILDDPKSNNVPIESSDTEMISPELTLQKGDTSKNSPEEPKLTDIIEEELNKPIKAPKIGQQPSKPVVKAVKEVEAVQETEVHEEITHKPVQSETPPEPEKSTPPATEAPAKTETAAPVTKKTEPVAAKPKEVVSAPKVSGIQYFIQVGSYRQTPSKRFLSVIKNNGFAYHITAPTNKGIKKLLIGPYSDRTTANSALVRVKDLINKSAFVVKK